MGSSSSHCADATRAVDLWAGSDAGGGAACGRAITQRRADFEAAAHQIPGMVNMKTAETIRTGVVWKEHGAKSGSG